MRIRFGKLKGEQTRQAKAARGEGRFRIVRPADSNTVVKTHRNHIQKDYGSFQVEYPLSPYIRFKFGVRDLNQAEAGNYAKIIARLPSSLHRCIAPITEVRGPRGKSELKMRRVTNFDGSPSEPLSSFKRVSNEHFWMTFNALVDAFVAHRIPVLDLAPENIMVKKETPTNWIPVLVDYKRMNPRMYPFQPLVWTQKGQMKKIRRRAARIQKQFKADA